MSDPLVPAPGAGDDVSGRAIIVTGAGRGIGRGIALHLAAHGAHVVVAELNPHRCERIEGELAAVGGEHLVLQSDAADKAQIEDVVARTVETFGRVDGLVNNAVWFPGPEPLAGLGEETFDRVMAVTVKGYLWAMQAVHPHMARAGWGHIVNTASGAGVLGMAGFGAYAAAKEAVRALTRSAAREWGKDGIVVNCYCPGAFGFHGSTENPFGQAARDLYFFQHPTGHNGDPVDDIGPVIRFLCSDSSRYLTGATLMVDGGAYMFA